MLLLPDAQVDAYDELVALLLVILAYVYARSVQ